MPPGDMGGMPADGAVIDDATRATRQAAFAADGGSMSEQIYIMTAVRWLEVKTGTAVNPGNLMLEVVFPVVSDALGLTVAALQTEMATGQTLTEVITAQGGDVAAIRAALITAVSESNTMPDTTTAESIESFVDNLLTGQFGRPLEMATPTP